MSAKNTAYLITEDQDIAKSITNTFKAAGLTLLTTDTKNYVRWQEDHKEHGCLIVDSSKGAGSVDVLKNLAEEKIAIPVIVLVPHGVVQAAVQAMKAGAMDAVEKPIKSDVLMEAVRKSLALYGKLQKVIEEREVACERIASLTAREHEVINLMITGKPNREIATELGISPKTLDIHRSNVMDKMEARTVADLCRAYFLNRAEIAQLHLLL